MAKLDALWTRVPDEDARTYRLPGAVVAQGLSLELARQFPDTRVLAVMPQDRVTPKILEAFSGLEAVLTRSDGYDHVPLAWLQARGIRVFHLEGYATESVAQLALCFMLGLLRRVPEATRRLESDAWSRDGLVGRHLNEVTVGLVGAGRIGARVAELLSGLGATVVAYDLAPNRALDALPGFRWAESLEAVLAASDVLSLHVPLTEATRGMLDETRLALLPQGAVVVNTARGELVDTLALLGALDGHLGGYATDVLQGEPNPPDLQLLRGHACVWVTPHLGAHNHETLARRYRLSAELVQALLRGESTKLGFEL